MYLFLRKQIFIDSRKCYFLFFRYPFTAGMPCSDVATYFSEKIHTLGTGTIKSTCFKEPLEMTADNFVTAGGSLQP